MQKLTSPNSRFAAAAGAIFTAVVSTNAQGPAPSPLISLPSPPPAQVPAAPPQTTPAPALTKQDFEAFLDALIPSQLQNRNIAGAVVSVVRDGQILFQKGYGFADFEAKKPILPDQTLFRPGSISKLFTATAVMQLVEQGKLDLDRDVNEYLDFAIPQTYPEPVTLRRLLTHTAGFEETIKNLFVAHESDLKPLRTYLVNQMPARIFPPGKIVSYSNYGFTLAGYIVERASGEKFERYIDNHILRPLRMTNSTFDQPLPPQLAPQMSQGYLVATKKPHPFELGEVVPAGALSATAADMTRFMLAFLQGGSVDGVAILKPETVRQMEAREFELHPRINGLGTNFMEYWMDPIRVIGHGGDTVYFHSDMVLVPDAHVGYFISYNSLGKNVGGGRGEVMRAFMNRYFPNPAEPRSEIDPTSAKADGRAVSGVYGGTRRSDTTFLRLIALLDQFSVKSDHDGILTVEGNKNQRGELKKWKEINKRLIEPIVGGNLALILLTVFFWPVAVIVRRRYQRPLFTTKGDRVLYFLSRIVCLGELILILAPIITFSRGIEDIVLLGDRIDPWLQGLHIFAWVLMAGLLLLVIAAFRFAKLPGHGFWFRAHAILLAIGGIALGVFCWQYHFLDWSLRF